MKVKLSKIRITPKKLNLIADLVRNKKVDKALETLKFLPKKGAKYLYKAIQSAKSNAENNLKQSSSDLYIKEIIVNKGPVYKRIMPVSRGRAHRILKRTSNVIINLEVK